jgi:hypothetical protein
VAADCAELFGSGEGAQATGHLLSQLDHADVSFRAVVVGGYLPVGGEADARTAPEQHRPRAEPSPDDGDTRLSENGSRGGATSSRAPPGGPAHSAASGRLGAGGCPRTDFRGPDAAPG